MDLLKKKSDEKSDEEYAITINSTFIVKSISWKDSVWQIIASLIAFSLTIHIGINLSYSAILLPQLANAKSEIIVTTSEASWIASLLTLSLMVGSCIMGPLLDKYGRKKVCLLTAFPFVISWLIQANAKYVWHIYAARILSGFSAGLSMGSVVYVSETTHSGIRAMLLSLNSVFVSFGILLNCLLAYWFEWRTLAYIFAAVAILNFLTIYLIPESPHWLIVFRKDKEQAKKSLKWFYRDKQVFEDQYEIIIQSKLDKNGHLLKTQQQENQESTDKLNVYKQPSVYKPVIILFVLFLFQQLSGGYVIIFYAVDIFRKIGGTIHKDFNEFISLILLGTIRFIMALVSCFLSKKIGRRILMSISGIGMFITSLIAGLYMYFNINPNDGNVTLICVLLNIFFSSVGYLVIPWTLIGELLPIKVRGKLGGILVGVAYLLMFCVVKIFPFILEAIKMQTIFGILSVVNILGVCFIFLYLPETLGKSFMDIENYFTKSKSENVT